MQKMPKSESDPSRSNGGSKARAKDKLAALKTPSDLSDKKTAAVAEAVNGLLADAFVLYLKTKNFHWHVSGPNFRDYHKMFDEHAAQIYDSFDQLAERVRKLGRRTVRSYSEILQLATLKENTEEFVDADDMLLELIADNKAMTKALREAHGVCDDNDDVATASILELFIDETEKRTWFLFETARNAGPGGH